MRFRVFKKLRRASDRTLSGWTFLDAPQIQLTIDIFSDLSLLLMVSKKRNLEDDTSPKLKKPKLAAEASSDKKQKRVKAKVKAEKSLGTTSNIVPEEIDFPRGGGTTFTPQEVKAIRAEAMTEADDLFKVRMKYVVFVSSPLIRCAKGTSTEVEKVTQKLGYQE